jgi:hypothetical protein
LLAKINQLHNSKEKTKKEIQVPFGHRIPIFVVFLKFHPLSNFLKAASRGILDVQSVEEKRKKKEKIEKQMATSGPPPAGGLRVSIKIYLRFNLMDIFENLYSNPINNLKMHYEKI